MIQWTNQDSETLRQLTTALDLPIRHRQQIEKGYLWYTRGPLQPFSQSNAPKPQSYVAPIALIVIPLCLVISFAIYYNFADKTAQGNENSIFATLVTTATIFLGLLLTFLINSFAVNSQAERLAEIHKQIAKDRWSHYLLLPNRLWIFLPVPTGARLSLAHDIPLTNIAAIKTLPNGLALYVDSLTPITLQLNPENTQTLHQLIIQQNPELATS